MQQNLEILRKQIDENHKKDGESLQSKIREKMFYEEQRKEAEKIEMESFQSRLIQFKEMRETLSEQINERNKILVRFSIIFRKKEKL